MENNDHCARTVVAISAFRSDDSVIEMLRRLYAAGPSPFKEIIVVDSMGTGRIAECAAEAGWPIRYINADLNLGSAGNLARRLEAAASGDGDWCFTVNHDGYIDAQLVANLVRLGESIDGVGAVYPVLRYARRDNLFDAPRTHLRPFVRTFKSLPPERIVSVKWGSSNMALYRLQPVREGLAVWADLWMGWEDLGYGGLLFQHGWKQLASTGIVIREDYEYDAIEVGGVRLHLVNKPVFYSYYNIRNLLLICRRLKAGWMFRLDILLKFLKENAFNLVVRDKKLARLKLLWLGSLHGLKALGGKGPVP